MIKNMTRKGLAIGAAIALGLSALVTVPAQALVVDSARVTLTPTTGTGTNVLAVNGASMSLSSLVASSVRGAASTGLKFLVKDSAERLTASGGTSSARAADGSFIVDVASASAGTVVLTMGTAPTTSYAVEVTAWFDDLADDVVGASEVGNTVTVNFLAASAVSSSVVVDTPVIGATSFAGYVVTSPELNWAQSTAPTVKYTLQGFSGELDATVSSSTPDKRWNFSAPLGTLNQSVVLTGFSVGAVTNPSGNARAILVTSAGHPFAVGNPATVVVAGATASGGSNPGDFNGTRTVATPLTANTFTLSLQNNGPAIGATYDVSAATITGTVATNYGSIVAGTYSATPVVGTNRGTTNTFVVATATAADGESFIADDANNSVTIDVDGDAVSVIRAGTLSASVTMSFFAANEAPLAANRPVVVTVTGGSLPTGLRVNGVAVVNNSALTVLTNASGEVTANLTATAAAAGTAVTLTGVAEGQGASSTFATFNWTAAAYELYDLKNGVAANTNRAITAGGSYTFDVAVLDQWRVGPTATGSTTVRATVTGNSVTTFFTTLTNGRASVTVSDAQIAAGNVNVTLEGGTRATNGTFTAAGGNQTKSFVLVPRALSGAAISGAGGTAAIQTIDLVAGDLRLNKNVIAATGGVTITGSVTDAITAVVRPGATVTVSGPANVFFTDGNNRSAFGSLTLIASNTGSYTVHAHSNIAQVDSVVTLSSEGASRDVKVTFSPAVHNTGANVAIAAPASVLPGSTLTYVVSVTDKFGNAINTGSGLSDLVVSYNGPGFTVSMPSETDATGTATVRVLLGSADSGPATLTVTYRKDGSTVAANQITATKTVSIGATAARGWTKDMGDGTVKLYARDLVGAGKVQFFHNGREVAWIRAVDATDPKLNIASDGMVRTRALVSGRNVFEIKVNGVTLVRRIATGS
jgi:trimeric autotransporter adhesin